MEDGVEGRYRPATIEEAVESILILMLKESRTRALSWFREKRGEEFASVVERLVKQRWSKMKIGKKGD